MVIVEEGTTALTEYGATPIAFEVRAVLDVFAGADHGFRLVPREITSPYVKDYDVLGGSPAAWGDRFDLSTWGFLSAFNGAQCVGRAAIARDGAAFELPETRSHLAVLWDIRVAPEARRNGVGSALFAAAATWAASRGCPQLVAETQNVNVAACRFYERLGCVLGTVRPGAYPELPDEIQLLWFKDLEDIVPLRSHGV